MKKYAAAVLSMLFAGGAPAAEMDCNRLKHGMTTADFAQLSSQHQSDPMTLQSALVACGEDFDGLHTRLCQRAYGREELDFVYVHCPAEAWSLARAQCERTTGTESEKYAAFCRDFKSGRAPILGR